MLVYGDHCEICDPRQRAREIDRLLETIETMGPGLQRHARLVSALVETGELLQGLADWAFEQEQVDRRSEATDELGASLHAIARALCCSWDGALEKLLPLPRVQARPDWPCAVQLRSPEGFAYYALYPEAYIEAARRLKLVAPPLVIGIRSIGTSLGAVAAAALGASVPTIVRPIGDAFDRRFAIGPELERELFESEFHYVIVDEGPGQSGSSFGAVGDWLADRGVPVERIALLPSHPGPPGPAATEQRRRWWRSVQRQVGDFGEFWPKLVARWSRDMIGRLDEPPTDISGGAWRELRYGSAQQWPPVVPAWERRKFLLRVQGEPFVAKFAGLGRVGEDKLAIARTLHCDGLVPEPVGLAHGFIVERWLGDALPLGPAEKPIAAIARYIGTRARVLPASAGSGASAGKLLDMARRNVALEFGGKTACALDPLQSCTKDLDRKMVRVRTDNRLGRCEWLRTSSDRLIKSDAVDHHRGHDLIGCQDIAWDCAGAIVEFELDQFEADRLVADVTQWSGFDVDTELLQFCRIAYLAFRVGQMRLGATMVCNASEQHWLELRGDLYRLELQHLLESSSPATRPKPLVD